MPSVKSKRRSVMRIAISQSWFIYLFLTVLTLCCCSGLSLVAVSGLPPHQAYALGSRAPWHVESSQTRDRTHVAALAFGFLTTGPPGKSLFFFFFLMMDSSRGLDFLWRFHSNRIGQPTFSDQRVQRLFNLKLQKFHGIGWGLCWNCNRKQILSLPSPVFFTETRVVSNSAAQ